MALPHEATAGMTDYGLESRRIRILRDEVSRKIAAGEVIDRPLSIVRELLDNAIDAGSKSIDVYLEGGGTARVRVVDDGAGMGREDLQLCWQPHATSKIQTEDDLSRVSSLGFRGEALSSIAATSRLEIASARDDGGPACRLMAKDGKLLSLETCHGKRGTIVDVTELFFNYPARRKFLRSVSAEAGLCKAVFLDRAVAHPWIGFRLFTDSHLALALPPSELLDRVSHAYSRLIDPRMLGEAVEKGDGFQVKIIAAQPELRREERKLVQVFVNRRRVSEFSLIQAAEYGYAGHLPGGWHPVAFVFVEIDPGLVDFNIHPAKKEVRFRNLPAVHKAVVAAVKKLLGQWSALSGPGRQRADAPTFTMPALLPAHGERAESGLGPGSAGAWNPRSTAGAAEGSDMDRIRFLGQAFGVFLIFELPDRLLILDQHAAHEKMLYERIGSGKHEMQELLFPVAFDASEDEDLRISREVGGLGSLGIAVRRTGPRAWEITAVSGNLQALKEEDLVEMVRGTGGERWQEKLRASAACKLAIKEGDPVDPEGARVLCLGALALEVPRCPHGRPILHEISREKLYEVVDRPVRNEHA